MNLHTNRPTREEVAASEVGQTSISIRLAIVCTCLFCITISSVPIIQQSIDLYGSRTVRGPFRLSEYARGWIQSPFMANTGLMQEMNRYESELEERSFLKSIFLGPTQYLLTRWLQAGNEQVYPGIYPWLYYRPDIDYAIQPGFLNKRHKKKETPVSTILDFQQQLAQRGITLILLPTPVKPTIHPEFFTSRYGVRSPPLHNASYTNLLTNLRQRGVHLFDPTPHLIERASLSNQLQYLQTDTHLTFEAMTVTAQQLAFYIKEHMKPPPKTISYKQTEQVVTNQRDIAVMLKLPSSHAFYPQEIQTLQQVLTPNDELWKPELSADILLLGDSFSNIYSLEGMGWGTSAGLAEQLSFYLQRPLDAIFRNDAGAYATRQILSQSLARGRDRLDGKKIVIWQFAARELFQGDWKKYSLKLGQSQLSDFYSPTTTISGSGTIAVISRSPKPGTVPYKDNMITLHLVDLVIPAITSLQQALVYTWGMRKNRLTQAAYLRPGDRVELSLSLWLEVENKYGGYRRTPLDDVDVELEEPCWSEHINR
ncbi:MAG: hypothetical protein GKR87_11020 [Kiritimatiellae bacterium]|nr:hypothetical protein [Kiritimatiellia bacterium]